MSNLVNHTRRELELVGEEPETIEGLVAVVQAFADMSHSGGSAFVAISMLERLLRFQNLTPLTDDPDEWEFHDEAISGRPGGLWQNQRDGGAFSHDGGKTYYLISDGANQSRPEPLYKSQHKEKNE